MSESKKSRFDKVLRIALLTVLVIQFLIIVFFNLKMIESHMDFDSSSAFLKAAFAWRERSLISPLWNDVTTPGFDGSIPAASLLYGLTGKLFFSYGLVNLFVLGGIISCVIAIMRKCRADWTGILVALNLILCPYLTNGFGTFLDLGYFNCVLGGPSHYGVRMLTFLLISLEFLNIKEKKHISVLTFISFILCFVAGMSTGVYIVAMLLLPIIFYLILKMFIENDLKVFIKKEAIFDYICILFVFGGKLFSSKVLHLKVRDAGNSWTTVIDFWKNIGAPIQGYFKLLEVFPVDNANVSPFTIEGIDSIFPMFILIILFAAFIYAAIVTVRSIKNKTSGWETLLFFVSLIFFHHLLFSILNMQYGTPVFEERYLIPAFLVLAILTGLMIKDLNIKLIISKFILIGLFVCVLCIDIISDKGYIDSSDDFVVKNQIRDLAEKEGAGLIYFYGVMDAEHGQGYLLCRQMRVFDLERVYKYALFSGRFYHWGDYLYYEDNGEYDSKTLFVFDSNDIENVDDNLLSQLEYVESIDWMDIYTCDHNPLDYCTGIYGDVSADYPTTTGMEINNSEIEGNSAISDGTEGFVMYGPYTDTPDGTYDFILDYSLIEGDDAFFDVLTDSRDELGIVYLSPDENMALIDNVSLSSGHKLEYRVYCGEGTKIKIDKITIVKDGTAGY